MGFVRIMCFVVVVVMISGERSNGTSFTVGDTTGWQVPPQTDFYENWTNEKNFVVGDQLTFTWTGTHDVAIVNETEYEGCTMVSNNVSSTSPVTITLEKTGEHYFICTIGNHCRSGQKLEIDVKASNTTAGSPPSTPTNGTTSPPPPSSATSFAPVASLCATISFLVFSFLA